MKALVAAKSTREAHILGADARFSANDHEGAEDLASPLELTDAQLCAEAEAMALRVARSTLPVRDVQILISLAARLEARNWARDAAEVTA